uniref:Uncharacterized protein n=1 Tax=Rhizophora mucronata TaxID=61149 RepID=A0A2P2Q3S2_RHIMU
MLVQKTKSSVHTSTSPAFKSVCSCLDKLEPLQKLGKGLKVEH